MVTISDLPLPAVQLLTRHARGKIIQGSNRFACVCRQWRDADSSNEQGDPLQLFADLRHMSDADTSRAITWMTTHGQQVQVLALQGSMEQHLPPGLLGGAVPSLTSLTWLEVSQRHSLVLLAPVLGQLPQLKHLMAAVDLGRHPDDDAPDDDDEPYTGVFLDPSGQWWEQAPDMQRLCPQLTHLHLRLDAQACYIQAGTQLAQLLPTQLQQLTFEANLDLLVSCDTAALRHMNALQQLTYDGIEMTWEDARELGQVLKGLQQLRLYNPDTSYNDHTVRQLPKLTGFSLHAHVSAAVAVMPSLVHLTHAVLTWREPSVCEGTAAALAALTGLQELSLGIALGGEGMAGVLQQVAGMSALRSLKLEGWVEDPSELSSGLAQGTQLTALALVVCVTGAGVQGGHDATYMPVPEAMTGLRCLTVHASVLGHEGGGWLAPLTQLTSLCVHLPYKHVCLPGGQVCGDAAEQPMQSGCWAAAQGLLQQVGQWPASLRQVLFQVVGRPKGNKGPGAKPSCWEFTPVESSVGQQVSVWLEEGPGAAAAGWARPFQPCPCLPGVWELQGRTQKSYSSRPMPA
jgi:hypothetical protein